MLRKQNSFIKCLPKNRTASDSNDLYYTQRRWNTIQLTLGKINVNRVYNTYICTTSIVIRVTSIGAGHCYHLLLAFSKTSG